MCGIAGLVHLHGEVRSESSLGDVRRMSDALVHRGPDDEGTWESPDRKVALSHRRLAIVDLSPLGRNPMLWDGGRLAISYNGEIYNFLELRAELQYEGYQFRSQTDTEVILAAYDRWGVDCVHRFAGMFAFALWDSVRQRLWLVRDRVGKKPLYYSEFNGCLAFASELKALMVNADLARTIDREALRMYLRYGYVPAPLTIFQHARKLPPAHSLICENGRITISRYWDPRTFVNRAADIGDAEAEHQLESLLALAVRQRQIADVPLGAFLSGGIDSSLIVALMAEQHSGPVKTYTIRFDNPAYNEADHSAAVAKHLGTDHHEELCDARQMLEIVGRLPEMFDEPFGDSSAIPTFLVSKAARSGVTVALSGDGGDELFFGYPRYRAYAEAMWLLNLPPGIRAIIASAARRVSVRRVQRVADVLTNDEADHYSRFVTWAPRDLVHQLTGDYAHDAPFYREMLDAIGASVPRELQPSLLDFVSYLPDDILAKVDRTSMAVSLEVRAPLLDHRVAEFALGLPLRLKYRDRQTKWLLRRLLYKRVPRELIDRPKMGFGVPLTDWFRGPLREPMADMLAGNDLRDLGLDPEPARVLWREFNEGAAQHRSDVVWQLFALLGWARHYRDIRAAA